jgi:radical SAM protein with 4Fe4S-binding SPASM domain
LRAVAPSTARPLYLRSDVALEASPSGFVLRRPGAGVVHQLDLADAVGVSLYAHLGDFDQVAAHLAQLADEATGMARAMSVLERWSTYLGSGEPRPISQRLLAQFQASQPGDRLQREAAPAAISWLVTLTCNRRCPYCYYKVLPWDGTATTPADATFAQADVFRMVDEMALLGTSTLYLTGGEPLLRADLVTIIQRAAAHGIRVHLNTKYFISDGLARALHDAGIHEVSYSLDAATDKIADAMAGHKGYLQEAIASVSALLRAGVETRVNAVATSTSATDLLGLARLCLSLGVRNLTVSPFMEPGFARSSHIKLIRLGPPLGQVVAQLQKEVGQRLQLTVGSAEAVASSSRVDCSDRLLCEVGLKTLDVLPDGRVTRCRYSPGDDMLVVGDLRRQSLLQVWNGEPLLKLTLPSAEQFPETACGSCGERDACSGRGRCIVGAKLRHGEYLAPDAACVH